ncbi:hypothetical protein QR680_019019 [Steinernema hermaphroditum]|uniref:Uncharacterized protein n=1 Tax=Steinernema hermaphroditum TaxID=289476 RepID=A0AA39LR83_9BILA|nr:hypothetical protein QR680_019019 [Steinernema hermaphroditum]
MGSVVWLAVGKCGMAWENVGEAWKTWKRHGNKEIWGTCYLDDYRVFAILRGVGFVFATLGNGFIVFLILRSKAIRKERFNLLIILLASAAV